MPNTSLTPDLPEDASAMPTSAVVGASGPVPSSPADGERMVIFVRTFDFLAWLLPMTNHFPRAQRHTITQRLLDAAMDLRERLEEANQRPGESRRERLERADECFVQHRGANPRPVAEGVPFLGFTVYPDRRRLKRPSAPPFVK